MVIHLNNLQHLSLFLNLLNGNEEKGQYIDHRGHVRTEKERKYPVDVHLLKKICAMHPIVKSVH